MMNPGCWVAEHVVLPGPCEGRLQRAHLVPQQLIKRDMGGPTALSCDVCGARPGEPCRNLAASGRALGANRHHEARRGAWKGLLWDARCWVPMCEMHHHALDFKRVLRIPRDALPAAVEEFAAEYGFTNWLEREYGPLELAA